MGFLSRILAPVEFSERCERAARYARSLAECFESELTILHVLASPGDLDEESYRKLVSHLERRLHEFGSSEVSRFPVRRLAVKGDVSRKIVQYSQDERIDLIVMPTRGFGPYRRFILGSNTAKVLHDADCAVCTGVHLDEAPAPGLPPESILCAVDLGPQSRTVLAFACGLQRRFAARVTVAHAVSAGSLEPAARKELEQLVCETVLGADLLVEAGDPAQVISEAAGRTGANILVIGRGSASGSFGRLRTNAYAMIRQSPCPVFSV
ncbi:MAG: hypothetical protein C5B51_29980 [Terriglobia bacterium]|nr:MAG: hypothetical protein C5B51_29980 [Terriglobia bacterium]